jgi:hypothetical protein
MQALDPRSTLEKPVPDKIGATPYNAKRILYIRDKNYVLILGDDLTRLKEDGFADYDERALVGRYISNNIEIPKGAIEAAKKIDVDDGFKGNMDSTENLEILARTLMKDADATLADTKKIVNFEFLGEGIKSPPQRSPSRLDAKSSPSKKPKIDPTPEMYTQLFGHPEPADKRGDEKTPLKMLKEMWEPYRLAVTYLMLKDARLRTFIGEGKNIYERLVSLHELQLDYIKANRNTLRFKTVESVELGSRLPVSAPKSAFYVDVNRNVNQASTASLVLYSRTIPRQASSTSNAMYVSSDPFYKATEISSNLSAGVDANSLESALASTIEPISFVGRDPSMSVDGFGVNTGLHVLKDKKWNADKLASVEMAARYKNRGERGRIVYMAKFDPENGKFGVLFPAFEDVPVGGNGMYTIYAFKNSRKDGNSVQNYATITVAGTIDPSEISVSHAGHYVIGGKLYFWLDGMDGENMLEQKTLNSNYLLIANNLIFNAIGTSINIDRFEWGTPDYILPVAAIPIGEGIESIDVYNRMAVVLFEKGSKIALVDILATAVMCVMDVLPEDLNKRNRPFATATTFGYVCMDTAEVRVCVDSMGFLPPAPASEPAAASAVAAQPPENENEMDVDVEAGAGANVETAQLQKPKSVRRKNIFDKLTRYEVLRYVQLQLMYNYTDRDKTIPIEKKEYKRKLEIKKSDYFTYNADKYLVGLRDTISLLCNEKDGKLDQSDWNFIAAEDLFAVYKLVALDEKSAPPKFESSSPLSIRRLLEKNAYGILGIIGGYRARYASPFTPVNIQDTPDGVEKAMSTAAGSMRLRAHLMTGIADQIPASRAMKSEKWEELCDALELGQYDYNLSITGGGGADAETADEDADAETADEGVVYDSDLEM